MQRLISTLAVVGLMAAGCSSVPGPDPVGTVTPLAGLVEILTADEEWAVVTEQTEIAPGDQVRSNVEGAARLQLSDQGTVELGPSSRVRMNSGGGSELLSGSLLAEGSDLSVTFGRVTVRPEAAGAFRVDRGLSTRVGLYRGEAMVSALGGGLGVRALRQADLVANAILSNPTPLQVSAEDAWDVRMLGPAIEAGLELAALERGVRAELARERDLAGTLAGVLPGEVSPGRIRSLLLDHRGLAGRVFLALAVATHAVEGGDDAIPVARSILGQLGQGASWTVVVAGLGVEPPALLAAVDALIATIGIVPVPDVSGDPSPEPDPSPTAGGPSPSPTGGDPTPDPCADPDTEGCAGEDDCPPGDDVCEGIDEVIDQTGTGLGEGRNGDDPPPPLGDGDGPLSL
jgi:hypothetical protein